MILSILHYHYCYISSDDTVYNEDEIQTAVSTMAGGYTGVVLPERIGLFTRIFAQMFFIARNIGSSTRAR